MIPPHELRKKSFNKAVRGYAPTEVDQYVDFLIDKYTQLYREYMDLERKNHIVTTKYEELAADEESIRSAVLKAQKLSEAMVANARKKADDIVFTVEDRCKKVLEENEQKIRQEKETLASLRKMALDFQEKLYSQYLTHVKLIKEMDLPTPENVDQDLIQETEIAKRAMEELEPQKEVMEASDSATAENQ